MYFRYHGGMRAGRLLNLLLLLQARGRASAPWLAGETGVSVRTILRDIDELSTSGVPVRSVRGADGGFELIEGWRTRLTGLTPAEALASLPAGWQGDAHRIASRFHVDNVGWYRREERPGHLPAIADAVWKDQRLAIRYDSWKGIVDRTIEPLGLVVKAGEWYLVALAGKEATARTYRLSNIQELKPLGRFRRPRKFELAAYWAESIARFEAGLYRGTATVRATEKGLKRLRYLSAAVAEAVERAQPQPDRNGWHRVTIPIESVEMAALELLKVGAECEVLQPPELRRRIAANAREISGRYSA